ncbi:MAG: thioredoxin family protein, partial [Vicinamibacteria bacterium]|nr:thioredoxin family protein [Vicinamibacteria bacterium]
MKIRAITCLAFWMGGALAAQATPQASVSFIENDFDVALQKAREQDRPLMVYAWAPWCHTCLSVKNFVFTDPALARLAQRFIWLKVDTEEARNAGFLERHTIEGVPTFFIIDPHNGAVLVRWLGSATLEQITRLLDEGHALARRSRSSLYKDLSRADRAYGRGDNSAAADAYEKLLGRAPQDWPARPRVTESLLYALNAAGRAEDCARIARASFAPLGASPSAAIIAAVGLDCAVAVEASKAARAEWIRALERDARAAIALPKETLAADDRSGVYAALLGARQDARDGAGARAVAEEWAVFLEGAAARAETPEGRSVYDSHRLTAYLAL